LGEYRTVVARFARFRYSQAMRNTCRTLLLDLRLGLIGPWAFV
jgi:hypothetical protein